MKRFWVMGVAVVFVVLVGVYGAARYGLLPRGTWLDYFAQEVDFVRGWVEVLRGCADADAAEAAVKGNKEGGMVLRMADGSWVAVVMEHKCCTGAGFNATVYVMSDGRAFVDEDTCYCGRTDLDWSLEVYELRDGESFLEQVRERGIDLRVCE